MVNLIKKKVILFCGNSTPWVIKAEEGKEPMVLRESRKSNLVNITCVPEGHRNDWSYLSTW